MEVEYSMKRGWRARQQAGRDRLKHKQATSEVRAQRRALLETYEELDREIAGVDVDAAAAAAAIAANEAALAAEAKAKADAEAQNKADADARADAVKAAGKKAHGKKAEPKVDTEGALEE